MVMAGFQDRPTVRVHSLESLGRQRGSCEQVVAEALDLVKRRGKVSVGVQSLSAARVFLDCATKGTKTGESEAERL